MFAVVVMSIACDVSSDVRGVWRMMRRASKQGLRAVHSVSECLILGETQEIRTRPVVNPIAMVHRASEDYRFMQRTGAGRLVSRLYKRNCLTKYVSIA